MNFDEEFLDDDFNEFLNNNSIDNLCKMNINQFQVATPKINKTKEELQKEEEKRKQRELKEKLEKQRKEEENKRKAFMSFYNQVKFACQNGRFKIEDLIAKYHKQEEYKKYILQEGNNNNITPNVKETHGAEKIMVLPKPKVYALVTNKIVSSRMLFFEKGEKSNPGCKRCKQLFFLNKNLKAKVERVYSILNQVKRKYSALLNRGKTLASLCKTENALVDNKSQVNQMVRVKINDLLEINENLKERVAELVEQLKQKEELIRKNQIIDNNKQLYQIGNKINKFKSRVCFNDFNRIKQYKIKIDDLKIKHYQEEIELIKNQVDNEIQEETTATETDSTSEYSS